MANLPSFLLPLFTRVRGETVWKLLRTGQAPHHQPRHRRINKGLSGCAQPLVVFGHPPVVADPREGALHHPPPRQHPETPRRHQPLPVHLFALLDPLLSPSLSYLLGERLFGRACALPPRSNPTPPQPTSCPSPGSRHRPIGEKDEERDRAPDPTAA